MSLVAEKEFSHIGKTCGCADHLNALRQYDQYLANEEGHPRLQALWRDLKAEVRSDVQRMKQLRAEEIRQNGF